MKIIKTEVQLSMTVLELQSLVAILNIAKPRNPMPPLDIGREIITLPQGIKNDAANLVDAIETLLGVTE